MWRSASPVLALLLAFATGAAGAQAGSSSSSSSRQGSQPKAAALDPGTLTGDTYRNAALGFRYKMPYGWVDRTAEMQEGSQAGHSQVLLSVFERPPGAPGNTVDSAVVIAAESTSSYPGLKRPEDYFGPLSELTSSQGFKVVNLPYEFPVDAKPIVRSDYSKSTSGFEMRQSSLVMISKGYVISFTFIGGNEDEVTELIEGLTFGGKK
jgi:hypothetical protein